MYCTELDRSNWDLGIENFVDTALFAETGLSAVDTDFVDTALLAAGIAVADTAAADTVAAGGHSLEPDFDIAVHQTDLLRPDLYPRHCSNNCQSALEPTGDPEP